MQQKKQTTKYKLLFTYINGYVDDEKRVNKEKKN
jgi:hypothetical protein